MSNVRCEYIQIFWLNLEQAWRGYKIESSIRKKSSGLLGTHEKESK